MSSAHANTAMLGVTHRTVSPDFSAKLPADNSSPLRNALHGVELRPLDHPNHIWSNDHELVSVPIAPCDTHCPCSYAAGAHTWAGRGARTCRPSGRFNPSDTAASTTGCTAQHTDPHAAALASRSDHWIEQNKDLSAADSGRFPN